MRIHRMIAVFLLVFLLMLSCCMSEKPVQPQEPNSSTESGGEPADVGTTAADTTADTTAPSTPEPQVPKSLKILAIGNSFSTDAMQYLYQMAKSAGVETIVLGNLYYGGCSLATHLSFAQADSPSYTYWKNTTGSWESTADYKMSAAIADEDWDYISLQQTSKTCGLPKSYGTTLTKLVDYVQAQNSTAQLIWHMTWAYQQDSTHSAFPNYDNSQQKMYEMIIDCVETCIKPETRFSLIIPCMTSIQNARTSYLGDTLTRDGYHLDYWIGRYIAGLTWFSAITGLSPDLVSFNPSTTKITEDMLAVAVESVKNAMETPYAVTESAIKSGTLPQAAEEIDPSVVLDPADFLEADTAAAASYGYDLRNYTRLDWDYLENTYWNCTAYAGTKTPSASGSTYQQNICTDRKYTLEEVPVGSLFILDDGWQYRLEIYEEENEKYAGKRPALQQQSLYELSSTLIGDCRYLAWNISAYPKADISAIYAQAAAHLRVYVPNEK